MSLSETTAPPPADRRLADHHTNDDIIEITDDLLRAMLVRDQPPPLPGRAHAPA